MIIEIKATEQCFPVVLFIMLYKVVLTFESVDEISRVSIQSYSEHFMVPGSLYFPENKVALLKHV